MRYRKSAGGGVGAGGDGTSEPHHNDEMSAVDQRFEVSYTLGFTDTEIDAEFNAYVANKKIPFFAMLFYIVFNSSLIPLLFQRSAFEGRHGLLAQVNVFVMVVHFTMLVGAFVIDHVNFSCCCSSELLSKVRYVWRMVLTMLQFTTGMHMLNRVVLGACAMDITVYDSVYCNPSPGFVPLDSFCSLMILGIFYQFAVPVHFFVTCVVWLALWSTLLLSSLHLVSMRSLGHVLSVNVTFLLVLVAHFYIQVRFLKYFSLSMYGYDADAWREMPVRRLRSEVDQENAQSSTSKSANEDSAFVKPSAHSFFPPSAQSLTTQLGNDGALSPPYPHRNSEADHSHDNQNKYKLNLRVFAAGGGRLKSFEPNQSNVEGAQDDDANSVVSDISEMSSITFGTRDTKGAGGNKSVSDSGFSFR